MSKILIYSHNVSNSDVFDPDVSDQCSVVMTILVLVTIIQSVDIDYRDNNFMNACIMQYLSRLLHPRKLKQK